MARVSAGSIRSSKTSSTTTSSSSGTCLERSTSSLSLFHILFIFLLCILYLKVFLMDEFDRYCLFGEWLWCQHSVRYESLPSFLVVFDIFDKTTNQFLSSNRIAEIIKDKLPLVPVRKEWDVRLLRFYLHVFYSILLLFIVYSLLNYLFIIYSLLFIIYYY